MMAKKEEKTILKWYVYMDNADAIRFGKYLFMV